ncbi:MAG: hypothetical protein IPP88_03655 [Betaproteobacteria bacterium]|nr:hypothetical protein [Betaproteobacteria bacterium]
MAGKNFVGVCGHTREHSDSDALDGTCLTHRSYGTASPPHNSVVRTHLPLNTNELSKESARASELLRGKVVSRVVRHREGAVMIEFADGTRFFVHQVSTGVELSITGIED